MTKAYPVVGRGFAVLARIPDVVVAVRVVRLVVLSALFEPFVMVRCMIRNEVHDDVNV